MKLKQLKASLQSERYHKKTLKEKIHYVTFYLIEHAGYKRNQPQVYFLNKVLNELVMKQKKLTPPIDIKDILENLEKPSNGKKLTLNQEYHTVQALILSSLDNPQEIRQLKEDYYYEILEEILISFGEISE